MKSRKQANKKGYNFLSVMTSVFLLSASTLIAFRLISICNTENNLNEKYFIANNLAESEVNKVFSQANKPKIDNSYDIKIDNTTYSVSISSKDYGTFSTVVFTYNEREYTVTFSI